MNLKMLSDKHLLFFIVFTWFKIEGSNSASLVLNLRTLGVLVSSEKSEKAKKNAP